VEVVSRPQSKNKERPTSVYSLKKRGSSKPKRKNSISFISSNNKSQLLGTSQKRRKTPNKRNQ